jgi:hypothetical protein
MGHNERIRVAQMSFQLSRAPHELPFGDQPFGNDPIAKVIDKLQEDRPATVIGSVNMDQRIDSNID